MLMTDGIHNFADKQYNEFGQGLPVQHIFSHNKKNNWVGTD